MEENSDYQLPGLPGAHKIAKVPENTVYDSLQTSSRGLSDDEAFRRLDIYGLNKIKEVRKKSLIIKFLQNFYHLFALLLWAGAILAYVGELPELAAAIVVVIIVNALFSFFQEFKAEKAVEALKTLLPKKATVFRDGSLQEIEAVSLVPGDVMVINEGDSISADARIVEEFELRTDNATLTGESAPVKRFSAPAHEDLTVTEYSDLVFAGTSAASGNGKAVAYSTGMHTEFGKIASLTQGIKEELSPLQKEMARATKIVAILAIGLGVVLFVLGSIRGMSFTDRFLFSVGIIVANVPEGLLPTVTLALAIAVQRMVGRHALVKKLSSVETLGSTTVICTDKTGTLTQNEMTVREIFAGGQRYDVTGVGYEPQGLILKDGNYIEKQELDKFVSRILKASTLCNTSKLLKPQDSAGWKVVGDPTEACLLVATKKADYSTKLIMDDNPRVYMLPFESARKRMSSINSTDDKIIAYVKGAPKETIALCTKWRLGDKVLELDEATRNRFVEENDRYAIDGLRVLAIAEREVTGLTEYTVDTVEKDLTLLGLIAMMDPPRPEVQAAVEIAHNAGIRIIMITGDYGLTAESIAKKIGIIKGRHAKIISGYELDNISDEALEAAVYKQNLIFARVTPEHKMKIVSALKNKGEIVAVTGDGVNDAPALRKADIGVAMGIAGTDVAKEASEMILTDDNFASIVSAVEEGRIVFENIKKFVTYIFAHLTPEIVPFMLFAVAGVPLAVNVLQILAIDLGTETLPALALGVEKGEPGLMSKPPRTTKESILSREILFRAYIYLGLIEAVLVLLAFFYVLYSGGWEPSIGISIMNPGHPLNLIYRQASTMAFISIVGTQIGTVFATRTNRISLFEVGLFTNKLVLWGVVFALTLTIAIVYIPFLQSIFGTATIPVFYWVIALAFGPIVLAADEFRKARIRKKGIIV